MRVPSTIEERFRFNSYLSACVVCGSKSCYSFPVFVMSEACVGRFSLRSKLTRQKKKQQTNMLRPFEIKRIFKLSA